MRPLIPQTKEADGSGKKSLMKIISYWHFAVAEYLFLVFKSRVKMLTKRYMRRCLRYGRRPISEVYKVKFLSAQMLIVGCSHTQRPL